MTTAPSPQAPITTEDRAAEDAADRPPTGRKSRTTPPTARTSALYRDLTRLLERLITADPALRTRLAAALADGPATAIDTLEVLADTHEGLRDGILTFVLDHVDYAALTARLGVPAEREGE